MSITPLGKIEVELLRVLHKEHGATAILMALSDVCFERREALYASMIRDAARLLYVSATTKGKPARGQTNTTVSSRTRRGSKGPR